MNNISFIVIFNRGKVETENIEVMQLWCPKAVYVHKQTDRQTVIYTGFCASLTRLKQQHIIIKRYGNWYRGK